MNLPKFPKTFTSLDIGKCTRKGLPWCSYQSKMKVHFLLAGERDACGERDA